MNLHIFNPEHDLSLASRLPLFTPPHAARQLRYDLGFLPALWADAGDVVLVDDVEMAHRGYDYFLGCCRRRMGVSPQRHSSVADDSAKDSPRFCTEHELRHLHISHIEPWGWDAPLSNRLVRCGVPAEALPSLDQLFATSILSHRRTSSVLLSRLQGDGMVGWAVECSTEMELNQALRDAFEQSLDWWPEGRAVIKAPWSSSGRGVRFVTPDINEQTVGWLRNLLERQGSVMVEPCYNKVCDFGMEFRSDGHGTVEYEGLSLFHTSNGAYTGNLLATETAKRLRLARYVPLQRLMDVRQRICELAAEVFADQYEGPFGVDMMVVAPPADSPGDTHFLMHPCVELNLRRTMGHVALALSPEDDELVRVMRIVPPPDHYKLTIEKTLK